MRALLSRLLSRARQSRLLRKAGAWAKGAGGAAASYHDPFSGTPPAN
jgi:hypothetical protein